MEQELFAVGNRDTWANLPQPAMPLTVGIDGAWVHGCAAKRRKGDSFELIVGKRMSETGPNRRFSFVNGYDTKPRRRLFKLLQQQGAQPYQKVILLSDGADTVRNVQMYLHPEAEHLLDWCHIVMRLGVLGQIAKGMSSKPGAESSDVQQQEPEPAPPQADLVKQLERVKWYLWHGNIFSTRRVIAEIETTLAGINKASQREQQSLRKLREFKDYITINQRFIVNYGDRHRNEEIISTAFVESTVNELVSHRFVQKQQMRWTKAGAHWLLHVRVQVLDGELARTLQRWYPGVKLEDAQPRAA